MGIVALDLLLLENKSGYVVVDIDYFTRVIATKLIKEKTFKNVVGLTKGGVKQGFYRIN